MFNQLVSFFISGFVFNNISWYKILLGVGLGIVFGAIWFTAYWTPILKKTWSWVVLASSAFLTWIVVSFIQIPLQAWTGNILNTFWSQEVLMRWLLLAGIPQILLSGLVQEGSKLVPVVIYWWRKGRNIDPKLGLAIGAVSGLGFGIFEAVWVYNTLFSSGWSWAAVQTSGLIALVPFWERFFTIALHIAICAIAGWGLARGWGWQFYLLASFIHAVANYSVVILTVGAITIGQLEIYVTVVALLATAGALWLRWRKLKVIPGIINA